jgi:hypothetical protein
MQSERKVDPQYTRKPVRRLQTTKPIAPGSRVCGVVTNAETTSGLSSGNCPDWHVCRAANYKRFRRPISVAQVSPPQPCARQSLTLLNTFR